MKRPVVVFFAMVIALSVALPTFGEETRPDYSREALLLVLRDRDPEAVGEGITLYRSRHWAFRWIPILAPIRVDDGPNGGGAMLAMVNPFHLLAVDYPARRASDLADVEPDSLSFAEKRHRRQLVAHVRAMNSADNAR